MSNYSEMCDASSQLNEYNDCAVTAVALAFDIRYKKAHVLLTRAGRQKRRATTTGVIRDVVEKLLGRNVPVTLKPTQNNGSRYTLKTIGKLYPTGRHLVFIRRHVVALIDGQIEDWSDNRRFRIDRVWTIKKGIARLPHPPTGRISPPKPGTKSSIVWSIANANNRATKQTIVGICINQGIDPGSASTMYSKWKRYQKQLGEKK